MLGIGKVAVTVDCRSSTPVSAPVPAPPGPPESAYCDCMKMWGKSWVGVININFGSKRTFALHSAIWYKK